MAAKKGPQAFGIGIVGDRVGPVGIALGAGEGRSVGGKLGSPEPVVGPGVIVNVGRAEGSGDGIGEG